MNTPETLTLTAAASFDAKADVDTPLSIVAYTGNAMTLAGYPYPVIVDLAGMEIGNPITLLADHAASVDNTLGAGTAEVLDNTLYVNGTLSRSAKRYAEIVGLHKSGVKFQASIGAKPGQTDLVKAPATITVNGRTHKIDRPTYIVRKSILRETSILPLGADASTTVRIAARKTPTMSDQTTTIDNDPVTIERNRVNGILKACGNYSDIAAKAIEGGWDENATNVAVLARMRAEKPYIGDINTRNTVPTPEPRDLIAAAALLHAGKSSIAEKVYGERVAQQAADLHCHSLLDLCAASLRAEGQTIPHDQSEMIRASFSTMALTVALSNLAEKSAAEAFREVPGVWDAICRRRTVRNFKEATIVRVFLTGDYEALADAGQIKHGTFSETNKTAQADTKAQMFVLTRKAVIDDDLSIFADVSAALGRNARRVMNDDFALTLLGNAGNYFHDDNGNYVEGAGTVLTSATLQTGITSMMKRTDAAGKLVDVRAVTLLVPPELEYTARQILRSSTVERYVASGTDNQPTGNPQFEALQLQVDPRLSSAAYAGYSTTAWYLFSNKADGAVNVALLNGVDRPMIEQIDPPSNQLGVGFRGYIDYGFSLGEPIAAYKSKGAA